MTNVKIKREYEAFLDGYKPVLIMATHSKYLHLVEHYPSYRFDECHLVVETSLGDDRFMVTRKQFQQKRTRSFRRISHLD